MQDEPLTVELLLASGARLVQAREPTMTIAQMKQALVQEWPQASVDSLKDRWPY